MKNKKQMQDDFNTFEVEIPMMLDDLSESVKRSFKKNVDILNFSIDSINLVEQFYLGVLNGEIKLDISESRLDRLFIAYLGESFRAHLNGHWTLETDKSFESFGTPVITAWGDASSSHLNFSPVIIRERIKKEEEKGELQKTIEFAIQFNESCKKL